MLIATNHTAIAKIIDDFSLIFNVINQKRKVLTDRLPECYQGARVSLLDRYCHFDSSVTDVMSNRCSERTRFRKFS